MKEQTEEKLVLSGPLDELQQILGHVVQLDRARTPEATQQALDQLLASMGSYTHAGRVYIFESVIGTDAFRNSAERCAPGVEPQIDNLQDLRESDMPYWLARFREGRSIVIENLEDARETMPNEYEILAPQNIKSLITFPITCKNELIGFVGLDDPVISQSGQLINLLALVGGHLGGSWANSHMGQLLESNREALEKEKSFLEVLCRDYTSVYHVNMLTGEGEILKVTANANTSRLLAPGECKLADYEALLRDYTRRYVIPAQSEDLERRLSMKELREKLADRERVTYRFRTVPNGDGHQYFEVQAICIRRTPEDFRVLIGFRHIDGIVAEEQRRQEELENALADAQTNYEVISALSKIYVSIFRIDLIHDLYDEISSTDKAHRLTGRGGCASAKLNEMCDTFVAPEYHDRVMQFLDLSTLPARLAKDETVAIEYRAKDGNWRVARFISKKWDENDRLTHVLYCTRSITDAKRREQNWIAIAEEASRANAAKTDFLSRMAHDIRTPMNAVRGFTTIARAHLDDPDKVREGLDKIELAGRYLQQIVDDVLDLSRIESGRVTIDRKPMSVSKLFREHRLTLEGSQGDKKLEYRFDLHDIAHDCIVADALRLEQIYMNLLSNAVKYTPDGGTVGFELFEQPVADKPDRVRLVAVIADNGIGMTPEYMETMYDKFSRAVDTRVNKVRGSGLGLAIVRQLVDLLGGTIEVQSKPGEGTTFRVAFEVPTAPDDAASAAPQPADSKADEALCRGMHLLVAEDNELNYEVVSELLEMYGVTCDRAEDGSVCVEKFSASAPDEYDAILMDVQMPVMDGMQAATTIRTLDHARSRSIPIIALTANALQSDIQRCTAAGMNSHLSKPIDVHQLLNALATLRRNG